MRKGGTAKQRRRMEADLDWQTAGYHMEEIPTENAEMVNRDNDPGYTVPRITADWQDAVVSDARSSERREAGFHEHLRTFIGRDDLPPEEADPAEGPQTQPAGDPGAQRAPLRWDRSRGKIAAIVAAVVLAVCLAAYVLTVTLTRIDDIRVEGNLRVSAEEVIRLSGLKKNTSVLFLDQEEIGARLARNPLLILSVVKRESLHQVVIRVREREPVAYINVNGYMYLLDDLGMVLGEISDQSVRPALLRVGSMEIKRCDVGQKITAFDENQLRTYSEIMIEIRIQGLLSVVSEMYVADLNNLSLATFDGFSVHLGDSRDIHAKIRAMELVRQALISRGVSGGTIDVSDCENPTHIPETTGS